jgi:hypothetical protein
MMKIYPSELEALEILTKSGRVSPQMEWTQAIHQAGDAIIALADKIKEERNGKGE